MTYGREKGTGVWGGGVSVGEDAQGALRDRKQKGQWEGARRAERGLQAQSRDEAGCTQELPASCRKPYQYLSPTPKQ